MDYAAQASWGNLAGKWANMQLTGEHSATVILARRATVDWSWPKKWNWCAWADLHLKKKKKIAGGKWMTFPPKSLQVRKMPPCEWTPYQVPPLPFSPDHFHWNLLFILQCKWTNDRGLPLSYDHFLWNLPFISKGKSTDNQASPPFFFGGGGAPVLLDSKDVREQFHSTMKFR